MMSRKSILLIVLLFVLLDSSCQQRPRPRPSPKPEPYKPSSREKSSSDSYHPYHPSSSSTSGSGSSGSSSSDQTWIAIIAVMVVISLLFTCIKSCHEEAEKQQEREEEAAKLRMYKKILDKLEAQKQKAAAPSLPVDPADYRPRGHSYEVSAKEQRTLAYNAPNLGPPSVVITQPPLMAGLSGRGQPLPSKTA